MARKKIGVLGGSFNPVHYGHISLAKQILDRKLVDEVWFSPSPCNPFKQDKVMPPPEERLAALETAIKDIPGLKTTDVELTLPVPSYTIDALDKLEEENPSDDFFLIMGADNLTGFVKWKNWEKILYHYGIIVYPRGESAVSLPEWIMPWKEKIQVLTDVPLFNISSTQLRHTPTP